MNRPLHDQLYLCYLPVPFYFSLSFRSFGLELRRFSGIIMGKVNKSKANQSE